MSHLLGRVRFGIYAFGVAAALAFGAREALATDTGSLNCVGNVVGTCSTVKECKVLCEQAGYGLMSSYCDGTTGCCHCDN